MPKYKTRIVVTIEADSENHADSDLHDLLSGSERIEDWLYEGDFEKVREPDAWVFFRDSSVVYVLVGASLDERARDLILRSIGADRCEPCLSWDGGDQEEILDKLNESILKEIK